MLRSVSSLRMDPPGFARASRAVWTRRHVPASDQYGPYIAKAALLVALYYGAAHLGYAFAFAGPVAAIVWLPVGVAIAFLYLAGIEFWPAVVAGDLLANNYSQLPVGTALGQTTGNLIEVLCATLIMRRLLGRQSQLDAVRDVAGLVLALAAGTALSALIGAISLRLGHVITTSALPKVARTWWLGDFSGALIVVPLALAWWRPPGSWFLRRRGIEAALALLAVIGLSALGFISDPPLSYLVFPALIWTALRFGERGASLAVAVASGVALWATTHYVGAFQSHSLTHNVLETQIFIGVASFSSLSLSAVVAERERLEEKLRTSRLRLLEAVDGERRRLERDLHDGIQQELVGLLMKLDQSAEVVGQDPGRGQLMIAGVSQHLYDTLESVRALARGIYPAMLHDHGVAEALRSAARRAPVPVSVVVDPVPRCSDAVEVAVYFCCLEAIQNSVKHAGADAAVRVRLWPERGWLHFEVTDVGRGFDAAEALGNGLNNMRDRVASVGGVLTVNSLRGRGTWVHGRVPVG